MKRYILRANFDIGNIESREENGRIMVDVPMLSNGKLNYGLSHVKKILYKENVYPSEIGFDIMLFATMVYMADTRIERAVHGQESWTREIQLEIPVSNVELWDSQISTVSVCLNFLQEISGKSHCLAERGNLVIRRKKEKKQTSLIRYCYSRVEWTVS